MMSHHIAAHWVVVYTVSVVMDVCTVCVNGAQYPQTEESKRRGGAITTTVT